MNDIKRIPALINGRDIAPEFEIYFDDYCAIRGNNTFLGYIEYAAVEVSWSEDSNCLRFHPFDASKIGDIQYRIYKVLECTIEEFDDKKEFNLQVSLDIEDNDIVMCFWYECGKDYQRPVLQKIEKKCIVTGSRYEVFPFYRKLVQHIRDHEGNWAEVLSLYMGVPISDSKYSAKVSILDEIVIGKHDEVSFSFLLVERNKNLYLWHDFLERRFHINIECRPYFHQ